MLSRLKRLDNTENQQLHKSAHSPGIAIRAGASGEGPYAPFPVPMPARPAVPPPEPAEPGAPPATAFGVGVLPAAVDPAAVGDIGGELAGPRAVGLIY